MNERISQIQIRRATAMDVAEMASVLYESFIEYESLYTPEGFAATTPKSDRIQERLSEGPTWVALRDKAIVGTVSALPKEDELYVRSMAILPLARGRGIGKLLLEQVEHFAREHGHARLFLSTTPFLLRAIRLYEHFRFERSDEGLHDLFGTPLFTMSKRLDGERSDANES